MDLKEIALRVAASGDGPVEVRLQRLLDSAASSKRPIHVDGAFGRMREFPGATGLVAHPDGTIELLGKGTKSLGRFTLQQLVGSYDDDADDVISEYEDKSKTRLE